MAAHERRHDSSQGTPQPQAPRISVDGAEGGRYVRVRFEGVLSIRAIEAVALEMFALDDFVPGMGTLWDLRAADASNTTSADLRQLRQSRAQLADRRGPGRVALLAEDDLTFGICRMVEASTEVPGIQIMVFRDELAAVGWVAGGDASDS